MKCVICRHGATSSGTMTATMERGDTVVVFKGVPAEICGNCGEAYLSVEVSKKLLQQSEEAVKVGVQVDIRKYAA
jgi:YgiT-type zinc finger domain-containing protein